MAGNISSIKVGGGVAQPGGRGMDQMPSVSALSVPPAAMTSLGALWVGRSWQGLLSAVQSVLLDSQSHTPREPAV